MLLKWKTGEFTTTNLTTHAVKNLNCECVCFLSIDSSAGIVCWWREFWTAAWCLFMSWTMVSTSWSAAHSSDLWSKSSGSCRFRESLLSWLVSTRHMTLSQLGCTITSICKTCVWFMNYYLYLFIYAWFSFGLGSWFSAGVKQRQWSEEASIVFRHHVEKKPMVAQLEAVQEATNPWERKLTVFLVDTSQEEKDTWVHDIMAEFADELTNEL